MPYPGCHLLAALGVLFFIQFTEYMVLARLNPRCPIEPCRASVRGADGIHVSQELGRGCDQLIRTNAGYGT